MAWDQVRCLGEKVLLLNKWNERRPLRHDLDKIAIHQSSHHVAFQKNYPITKHAVQTRMLTERVGWGERAR